MFSSRSEIRCVACGERRRGRLLVADRQRERHIAGTFVPNRRRARRNGVLDVDDGRQRLVVDREQLGRVARLRQRFRDHHRHAVADAAHLVDRQDRPARAQALGAADVLGHEVGRQSAEPFGLNVLAGEDAEDTGRLPRGGCVDLADAGMRMRRQHDECVT